MSSKRGLLAINPDPIKIVGPGEGLREAFKPYVPPKRCYHEDGRGQCTSLDTEAVFDFEAKTVEYLCPKHR